MAHPMDGIVYIRLDIASVGDYRSVISMEQAAVPAKALHYPRGIRSIHLGSGRCPLTGGCREIATGGTPESHHASIPANEKA